MAADMAGNILGRSLVRSERIWQAMQCRGFRGRFYTLRSPRPTLPGVLALCGVLAAAAGLLVLDVWLG
jgi:cobalt/nickel transport system permease protein